MLVTRPEQFDTISYYQVVIKLKGKRKKKVISLHNFFPSLHTDLREMFGRRNGNDSIE